MGAVQAGHAGHAPEPNLGRPDFISIKDVRQVFQIKADKDANGGRGSSATKDLVALENVSLEIPAGQFVALVGASGCGKTTLLNMIAGLIAPSHGSLLVDGARPSIPNHDVGYMFARDALLPWRTAQKNVELPLEVRGWDKKKREKVARAALKMVGLEGRESQFRLQLSQGMRQRVALARTFAANPKMLLMDEPFAALDARTKLTMQKEFLRLWELNPGADIRRTVIFVTHDLEEAVLLADRVIVMLPHPGRIASDELIDLPRPRAEELDEIMFTPEFRQIAHGLFESLQGAIPHQRAEKM